VPAEWIISLDHNKGANAFPGKVCDGLRNNFSSVLVGGSVLSFFPDYSQNRETLKESPEVFLEDNNEDKEENGKESLKDDGGKVKLEKLGNDIDKTKEAYSQQDKPGRPVLKPYKEGGDHHRDNRNVENILNSYTLEQCPDAVDHGIFFSRHVR
jgi:hypothetical protein